MEVDDDGGDVVGVLSKDLIALVEALLEQVGGATEALRRALRRRVDDGIEDVFRLVPVRKRNGGQ